MKKYLSLILVLLLAVSVFAGCAPKAEAPAETPAETPAEETLEPINLVVAHNQTSTENPYQYGLVKFKEVVEELS
jgi:TRAP-type C4-dicarboxylate transport system substrate-binding protein